MLLNLQDQRVEQGKQKKKKNNFPEFFLELT